jgi:hypothetical protein
MDSQSPEAVRRRHLHRYQCVRVGNCCDFRSWPIVLQKSKVAGLRIFRKNTKRKAIADSYNLYRVTEVAYEFNVRR